MFSNCRHTVFSNKFENLNAHIYKPTAVIQLQVHATGSQCAQNTHPAAAAGGATAGGGGRWRLGGPRPAAASGRVALRLGHQLAYNACGSPNSTPAHPSPFCFIILKPQTAWPSQTPRLCRKRLPVRESNLPVAHACQREWVPVREACFLYPTPMQKQVSRAGRQPSRSPRLPTGTSSGTGSTLPVPHASQTLDLANFFFLKFSCASANVKN